jgi:hypothetical protein
MNVHTDPAIKKVMSISLGSSTRDAVRKLDLGSCQFILERRGTDGDFTRAAALFREFDGKVDAFGLGGTDLYVFAGEKRYTLAESERLLQQVRYTPVVDGSGLKNSWEKQVIRELAVTHTVDFQNKKVLLVCAVDRFGMAQALTQQGCFLICGDILYGLNLNWPLHSLQQVSRAAAILVPIISHLPVRWFYPIGKQQQTRQLRFPEYFMDSDIIAGDFHFIRRFMPDSLPGKIVITNTVTEADLKFLQNAGVIKVVTTTPCLEGRSFGTNMLEAMLVAMSGSRKPLSTTAYEKMLHTLPIGYSCLNLA